MPAGLSRIHAAIDAISADPTSWWVGLPVLLVGILVLVLPGGVALALARMPGLVVAAAAIPVSVFLVAAAGVAYGALGLAWTPVTFLAACVAVWAVAAALGTRRPVDSDGPPMAALAASLGVAALLTAVPLVFVSDGIDAIPQSPDSIFHLLTIAGMATSDHISVVDAMQHAFPGEMSFYPAAFHALAATVVDLTGTSASTAATVIALGAAALAWPIGVTWLATRIYGATVDVVVAAPIVASAFAAFPTWLLGYGVLWPNLLGQALLPSALAATLWALDRPRAVRRWALLVIVVIGAAIAHPNTLFGYAVMTTTIIVIDLVQRGIRSSSVRSRLLWLGSAVAVLGMAVLVWRSATARAGRMLAIETPGPEMGWADAFSDVLLGGARNLPNAWVISAVVLIGIPVALRRPRARWVIVSWLLIGSAYILVTAVDNPTTRQLTWPWYSNSPRFAALLTVPMALLAIAALGGATRLLRRGSSLRRATVVTLALLVVTLGADLPQRILTLRPYFQPTQNQLWIGREQVRALTDLSEALPDGAVVAANPWNGGQYLPLVSDARMVFPTEKTAPTSPTQQFLGKNLDAVGSDPQVCSVAREVGVEWALDGGSPPWKGGDAITEYTGLSRLSTASGWEEVQHSGVYTLYRLTSCAQ